MKPSDATAFDDLPSDANERHEAAIDIFGRHLFSLRNSVNCTVREYVVSSQESRNQMGSVHRAEYDAAAELSPKQQEVAFGLAAKSVDLFMKNLLTLLQCNGMSTDLGAGSEHAISYELLLSFIRKSDLEPVECHSVNKNGRKVISEYYGRWLNRHSNA